MNTEVLLTILDIYSDCSIVIYKWSQHEQHEIMQNHSSLVRRELEKIKSNLSDLYITLIKLIVSEFEFVKSSKWKQAGKILAQEDIAWKEDLKTAKRIEAECEAKRSGPERILKFKEGNERILD